MKAQICSGCRTFTCAFPIDGKRGGKATCIDCAEILEECSVCHDRCCSDCRFSDSKDLSDKCGGCVQIILKEKKEMEKEIDRLRQEVEELREANN